jgi:hypothetical protein
MQWQADHASPNHDVNEWIDEQMGSVMKWPVPVLSSTRIEWLPKVQSDLFILQTPTHLSDERLRAVQDLIKTGQPVVLEGSFANGIDPVLLRLAGVRAETTTDQEQSRPCRAAAPRSDRVENMTYGFETYCVSTPVSTPSDAIVLYSEEGSAALVLNAAVGKRLALWNPPNLRSIEGKPLSEIWGNKGAPYALAASLFNELLQRNSALHSAKIDLTQTLDIAAWSTQEGKFRILAGNLEEGLRDDADFTRSAALSIPDSWHITGREWRDAWTGNTINAKNGVLPITLPQASSVLLRATR